jgi:hypothetical protein
VALHNELSSFEQMTSADLIVQKFRNDYILIIIEQLLLRKKKLSHCYFDQFLLADFLGMYSICLSFVFLLPGYVELNRSLFESFCFFLFISCQTDVLSIAQPCNKFCANKKKKEKTFFVPRN